MNGTVKRKKQKKEEHIISRSEQSQGLLYKHLCHLFINYFIYGLWNYLNGAVMLKLLKNGLLVIK